jgi:recombinational DNA repair ATPase RecF
MKINTVKAVAFGPFSGETLDLAPGMTVVYGPNESGKSSWHAAVYAALCGMKKSRGQPTKEDRAFTSRHRRWRGSSWRVTAIVSLDDGRTIEIDQALGPRGHSLATDRGTKRPFGDDIVRAGAIDAATLVGLTRETALATVFVRQADILRVLNEADGLQEFLERAAASSTVDTTADEALAQIAAYKRDRVGVVRAGARGPLATAGRRLAEARAVLDQAEEQFESNQELLARQHAEDADVRKLDSRRAEVERYEQERLRRNQWEEIRAAERQLALAQKLDREVLAGPTDAGPSKVVVDAVTRTLAAFEARPAQAAPLEGPTSEDIEQELEGLPVTPKGDLEPGPDVSRCREAWHHERQRLAAHASNQPQPPDESGDRQAGGTTASKLETELAALPEPPSGDLDPALQVVTDRDRWRRDHDRLRAHVEARPRSLAEGLPILQAVELRQLADSLEALVPTVDATLRDEVARRRTAIQPADTLQHETAPSGRPGVSSLPRVSIMIGTTIAVAGVLLLIVGQALAGMGGMALGAILVTTSLVRSRQRHTSTTPAAGPPPPQHDAELNRLEARLLLEEEAAAQAERRRTSASARAVELGLPVDPAELRRLAATRDANELERKQTADWEHRRVEIQKGLAASAENLRTSLEAHGTTVADDEDPDDAFQRYTAECRRRAQQALQASRRADLEARLRERRAAEAAHTIALQQVANWARRQAEIQTAVFDAENELQATLAVHGTRVADDEDPDDAFQRYTAECHQRAQQARQASRRADLEARLRERRAAEAAREHELLARATAERDLLAVASKVCQPDGCQPDEAATSLHKWLEEQASLEADRQQRAEKIARLDQLLDGRTLDELEMETAAIRADAGDPPPEDSPILLDRHDELEALQARVREGREALAELSGHIEAFEKHLLDVAKAVEDEARASAEVERLTALADDLDTATQIIHAAQDKVHADIAPVLNGIIRPWVSRITGGRYDDIRVDPATLEVQAHEVNGHFREASVLSHGTTEQLFLLLRLALSQALTTTAEKAPLVLDDITVQSDESRTVAILDLLHELSREHQVVLFSQENEVRVWSERNLQPPRDRTIDLPTPAAGR